MCCVYMCDSSIIVFVFMFSVLSEAVVQSVRLQLSDVSFKSRWVLSADTQWQSAVGSEQAVSWLWDWQINSCCWCVLPRTTSVLPASGCVDLVLSQFDTVCALCLNSSACFQTIFITAAYDNSSFRTLGILLKFQRITALIQQFDV